MASTRKNKQTRDTPYGMRDWVRISLGWCFIGLGLVGLVLPILQGILFLVIGAALLAPYLRFFHKMKVIFYRRFPAIRKKVKGWKRKVRERLHRSAS